MGRVRSAQPAPAMSLIPITGTRFPPAEAGSIIPRR